MNAHDHIVDAILAALRQSPAVTTGLIDEDIDIAAIPEGCDEAVSVSLTASDPGRSVLRDHPVQWTSTVLLECFARKDGRTLAGRASRALHQRAYERLMQDPSLGGVLIDLLEPGLVTDPEQADTRLGVTTATYTAVHRTAARSLEQPA